MKFSDIKARLIGVLIILPFFFYGIGNNLLESNFVLEDLLFLNKTEISIGVLLVLTNSIAIVGIGIYFFPLLKKYRPDIALLYLCTRLAEGLILVLGMLVLVALVPLTNDSSLSEQIALDFQNLQLFALRFHAYAYQIAMLILAIGSGPVFYLLYEKKLVPSYLGIWACLGYGLLMLGCILEILGYEYGLLLSIPGGLFELYFGIWLILERFNK